ncbi:MAG: hypothetical protein L0Y79_03495 [Chlorobi bacterium]|nr:hypothetical protein [Chlorobiota bacterium]MCI0715802.1 hypothetical protein [Chlorobiota bacterium]
MTLIKEVSLSSAPFDIIINESIAYVLTENAIIGFTTSDPYNTQQTSYSGLSGTSSIAFTGRFAYTLSSSGVNLYDFTKNPPAKKNIVSITGRIKKLVIDNGYLYILNEDAGLQVYDVNVGDFPIFKNTQVVPFNSSGIFVKDKKAYITSSHANLSIIDVGDLSKLPIVGSYNTGVNFYEPYVDGNYAYIPQGTGGVQVLNITKLPFPEWVTNLFARKSARQVVASNFYVWVADEISIEGFFIKDGKSFYFAGNYDNEDAVINRIAVIEGKYIYICSSDNKLKILRIDYKY